MGLTLTDAAWGIHRVVNENMAGAARVHGIERGKDLRAYPLFAFGGAGPVHAWQVGRILKVPRVLVPFGAGAMSAYGLLAAPLAFDFVRTAPQRLDAADWPQINRLFDEMEAEGRQHPARRRGGRPGRSRIRRTAEMRYLGQGHEVEVEVPAGRARPGQPRRDHRPTSRRPTARSTAAPPWACPSRRSTGASWSRARCPRSRVSGARWPAGGSRRGDARAEGHAQGVLPRGARLRRTRPSTTATRSRPGARLAGPAIIEERESTTVVGPGARVSVDEHRLTLIPSRRTEAA